MVVCVEASPYSLIRCLSINTQIHWQREITTTLLLSPVLLYVVSAVSSCFKTNFTFLLLALLIIQALIVRFKRMLLLFHSPFGTKTTCTRGFCPSGQTFVLLHLIVKQITPSAGIVIWPFDTYFDYGLTQVNTRHNYTSDIMPNDNPPPPWLSCKINESTGAQKQ